MPIYERPAEILQNLIRFDTTNPPGNEAACIDYVAGLLKDAGLDSTIVGKVPERTNLISRIPGRGDAPPLLIYGHVDVVPTAGQIWQHPPFDGVLVDDYVWGRGALDMKGADAMMIAAFLRAHAENLNPPGDVILALVSDEEAGGEYGAGFLVDNHPELFEGVKYALGEFGAFSQYVDDKCFYPIMMAEKRVCTVEVTVRGPGGHASTRTTGGTMARLAQVLLALDENRLPVHITPVVSQMIQAMAKYFDEPLSSQLVATLDPAQTDAVLDQMGPLGGTFDSVMHNTATPTIVQGGSAVNVIPAEIKLTLDGRVLPGVSTDDFLAELRELLGDDVELTPTIDRNVMPPPDFTLFSMLADVLRETDPAGIPIPYMVRGATDGRIFAKLGIQTYGFTPMKLPPDFAFAKTVHAADERIPVAALEFGADAIYRALGRFDI